MYSTQHADLAEQTFELQPRGRRGLGLGGGAAAAVVAFAFGPPEPSWQRFAVYFLTADGGLWSLCPVVPFGCRYPSSTVEQLAAACEGAAAGEAGPNAEAWLQRAFQPLSTAQEPAFGSGLTLSVPHALDDHVPALAGPLPVSSADGSAGEQQQQPGGGSPLMRLAGGADAAAALLLSRFGDGCTAVAVATARGYVGLHLLAGEAAPAWHEAAPQCVTDGPEILAVRSQARGGRRGRGADCSLPACLLACCWLAGECLR